jgi:hypothetical protein
VEEARQNVQRRGVERLVQIEQRDIVTLALTSASVVPKQVLRLGADAKGVAHSVYLLRAAAQQRALMRQVGSRAQQPPNVW